MKNINELKLEIADRKQGMFEMANLQRIHSMEEIQKLSPDLIELLKANFPLYFDAEKEKNGKYPESGNQDMKDKSFAEYKQIEEIANFCRLTLFSRAYDLLDNNMFDLKLEDWKSAYGRNFVYSLHSMVSKYIERMHGLEKAKWIEFGEKRAKEEMAKKSAGGKVEE